MVTIKNDIESTGVFVPTTQQAKDVNLQQRQGPKQRPRRRSYRCITIVSVIVVLLLALGIGSVLYFDRAVNRIPANANDGTPTSTLRSVPPLEPEKKPPPTFTDPFEPSAPEPEIAVNPADDDEYYIDGPPSPATSTTTGAAPSTIAVMTMTTSTTTTTTTTTHSPSLWINRGSGDDDSEGSASGEGDDDSEELGSGSHTSGHGSLW